MKVGNLPVHVFDGEAINLLLQQLDTAPDFISYLRGRAAALDTACPYRFFEEDLLAASIENWDAERGLSPHVPPIHVVTPGAWQRYQGSGQAEREALHNQKSLSIDKIIRHFHWAILERQRLPGCSSRVAEHEVALRLLTAESRFARRMIISPFYHILAKEDRSVPWAITIESPTQPGLRYLWLTYPDPSPKIGADAVPAAIDALLQHQALITASKFRTDRIVALAFPNRSAIENVVVMRVFESSNWTDADRRDARHLATEACVGDPVSVAFVYSA